MAEAQVVFEVECRETGFGDTICVVGGPGKLGAWDPAQALTLTTTAESFPKWSTKALQLPVGEPVEYKFVIIKKSNSKLWEAFDGNRTLTPQSGKQSVAHCHWGKKDPCWVEVRDEPAGPVAANKDKTSGLDLDLLAQKKDVLELADELKAREARRKNFSQSLLQVVDDSDEDAQAQPELTRAITPARHSMPLKHITSFSALTEMAAAADKEKIRKKAGYEPSYDPKNLNVPVVIATSEIAPYSKTGGLGLVAASYSYEFARKGHRTMAVSPKYKHYPGITCVGETQVFVNGNQETVKYWHKHENGCDYVFVDHPAIEKDGGLYNDDAGREYPDNLFRFTLLSLAAMEAPLILKLNGKDVYGQKVLFLANDWQAGLIPLYLCYKFRPNKTYTEARCIYVVHNLGYQGQYPGINACHFFGVSQAAANDLAYDKTVNLSKAALICCDRVLTVSENYCKEIQTAAGGFRLEAHVQAKAHAGRLEGILNGIDDCWNPEIDKSIARRYDAQTFVTAKAFNKTTLQQQLGLKESEKLVLIGFVGRLTWQKGIDVLTTIIDWLMEDTGNGVTGQIQIIMMGNGEKRYGDELRAAEVKYPGRVCGYVGFDPKVEHQMMAGCDLFLMPSRYEPCGLPQMYSQRYGTLPIVTATGGLVDSVKDVSQGCDKATGFHMAHLDAGKMKEVVYNAARLCLQEPDNFRRMQETAMNEDFYWPQAMDKYESCIDRTLAEPATAR